MTITFHLKVFFFCFFLGLSFAQQDRSAQQDIPLQQDRSAQQIVQRDKKQYSLFSPVRICSNIAKCLDDSPPKLTNIGYVGGSYDIFKGNPEAIGVLDPGFLFAQNIFKATYNEQKTTTDGAYLIPDGTTVNSVESCSFSFSSTSVSNTQSYTDSLKVHADANFKYLGASFSASADYQTVSKGTSSGQSVYVSSQAECQTYGASIDDAPMSEEFLSDVDNLSNEDSYIDLIRKWGTHVASSIMMGGRYGLRSEFTHTGYNSMVSSKLNIKAAGGYSGMMSLSASLTTDAQTEQAKSFENNRKDVKLFILGGKPPVDENGTAFQWAATVKETPMPISYSLTELYKYLIPDYFPHDSQIKQKQEKLHHALEPYCNMTVPNKDLCVMEFGEKSNSLIVSTANDLYYIGTDPKPSSGIIPYNQLSENPSFKAVGTVREQHNDDHYASPYVIPNANIDSDYLGSGFDPIISPNKKNMRFICMGGYNTISDYSHADYANLVPYTYPCIKDECLGQCNQGTKCSNDSSEDCYYIINGYPELGNPGNGGYYRDLSIDDDTPMKDLFKCLNYKCLKVV